MGNRVNEGERGYLKFDKGFQLIAAELDQNGPEKLAPASKIKCSWTYR